MRFLLGLILCAGLPCWAGPIYGQSASGELDGFRTVAGGGLISGGSYGDTFRIDWDITADPSGGWLYSYVLSGFTSPGISHMILDLCPTCAAPTQLSSVKPSGALDYSTFGSAPSNPSFPSGASVQGVKFDSLSGESPFSLVFHSSLSPVYGDLYLKGGKDSFVYNAGLPDHASADPLEFVARPGACAAVNSPEPGTAWTLGCGLILGTAMIRRRLR